jgi:Ran GTPase-activating protein (RanGAP) involved in mRNA processing and transport
MPEETVHLVKMLSVNHTLTTLDLSNCGVLDEGCIDLFRVGMMNHPSMKHLYLNTNGITVKSATVMAKYFEKADNLDSVYMSFNPLGDEGVRIIANSLRRNTHLVCLDSQVVQSETSESNRSS